MAIIDPGYETFIFDDDGVFPNNANFARIRLMQVFDAKPEVYLATIENTFRFGVKSYDALATNYSRAV
jgi:hypothetical protein